MLGVQNGDCPCASERARKERLGKEFDLASQGMVTRPDSQGAGQHGEAERHRVRSSQTSETIGGRADRAACARHMPRAALRRPSQINGCELAGRRPAAVRAAAGCAARGRRLAVDIDGVGVLPALGAAAVEGRARHDRAVMAGVRILPADRRARPAGFQRLDLRGIGALLVVVVQSCADAPNMPPIAALATAGDGGAGARSIGVSPGIGPLGMDGRRLVGQRASTAAARRRMDCCCRRTRQRPRPSGRQPRSWTASTSPRLIWRIWPRVYSTAP